MLPVARTWYEVEHAGDGIDRIRETHIADWMRCNMWLVRGRTHDLLIDSGIGLKPIKAEVASLRERPVTALCSHCHFDHIGCAHEFDERLGHRAEAAIMAAPDLDNSCARAWIGGELLTALPTAGFTLSSYRLTPAPLTGYLDDGDVVDLGDRVFNVLHLPGHSPGSIALYEKATRILFSGDVVYDGLFIDNAWHSDPEAYRHSLRRLRELPVETVHAGHYGSFGRDRLHELIDAYLAGGQRIADVAQFMQEETA